MTLIFDPAEACVQSGTLAGLDFIAMHSGVSFITGETWQHIIPFDGMGENGQPPILYPTGDGRFAITFTPSEFYGLDGEIVTEICAVFNNGTDWDQDGRDFVPIGPGCMDFFIPLNTMPRFLINPGDDLLCVGYSYALQSGIMDAPEESKNYTFQFATNIPCPGMPTVEYEGQVYNTVQIFNQCWLKENLNVGGMIQVNEEMTDNGIIEKYCYNSEPDSCTKHGGLYQWDEMMQYTIQPGARGICPTGWHVPTDEEWKVLEGSADSQYGIGDSIWNVLLFRGFDAGTNLKSSSGWLGYGNGTDLYGFSIFPGGFRSYNGYFSSAGHTAFIWTSMEYAYGSLYRIFQDDENGVNRSYSFKENGISVRCLRDE